MCRSGCITQDHRSWGECARSARFHTAGLAQRDEYKAFDAELRDYASAVEQGIQPTSTRRESIDAAVQLSNEAGRAV
jgi:hypothetical protein